MKKKSSNIRILKSYTGNFKGEKQLNLQGFRKNWRFNTLQTFTKNMTFVKITSGTNHICYIRQYLTRTPIYNNDERNNNRTSHCAVKDPRIQ